jgi:hypothetical protein
MNTELSLNVELSTEENEFELEAIALTPEGIALNENSWNLRNAIERELRPKLFALRNAYANGFKRFEDNFNPLALPKHIAMATKDCE